jgi:hypothetical protein
MSNDEKGGMGTADLGYVGVGRAASRQATEEEIQRGIDAAMRGVIADRWTNPNALRRPDNVRVANAPTVVDAGEPKRERGLVEPKELEPVVKPGSMEERVMSNLIDTALPPGVEKKDRR